MRRLLSAAALSTAGLLVVPLAPATAHASVSTLRYPYYHTVQHGEWLWGIARKFLAHVNGKTPSNHVVASEAATIYALNRKKIGPDPNQLHAGTRLLLANFWMDVADGKPGWFGGFGGCENQAPAAHSARPASGLTFTIQPHAVTYRSGALGTVTYSLHNSTGHVIKFGTSTMSGHEVVVHVLDAAGKAVGAVFTSDVLIPKRHAIQPHSTFRGLSPVHFATCGDTDPLGNPGLAAGTYRLVATLDWSTSDNRYGQWNAPAVSVRVTG